MRRRSLILRDGSGRDGRLRSVHSRVPIFLIVSSAVLKAARAG
jgi:hypothetical protein